MLICYQSKCNSFGRNWHFLIYYANNLRAPSRLVNHRGQAIVWLHLHSAGPWLHLHSWTNSGPSAVNVSNKVRKLTQSEERFPLQALYMRSICRAALIVRAPPSGGGAPEPLLCAFRNLLMTLIFVFFSLCTQPRVSACSIGFSVLMEMFHKFCTVQYGIHRLVGYWAFEMWLLQLRNWTLHFSSF